MFQNIKTFYEFQREGTSLKIESYRNCGGENQIIRILDNSTVEIKKCEILSFTCSDILPYKTAMVNFFFQYYTWNLVNSLNLFKYEMSFYKNNIKIFNEKVNLCAKGKPLGNMTKTTLGGFSIPETCPITSKKVR